MQKQKHIHFIGICGVAMSALAIAFHKKGYKVTGSDKGFYPPVSTYLKEAGVPYYPGWHVDKMTKNGDPDLVIVGNVAGSNNPEWLYVQEKKLQYKSYPEAIAEFFVKENSIVCAGTYGKTTSTSLLAWILQENDFDPSYMFGGISLNDMPAAKLTDSKYSILEGDEYKSARWDDGAKFFHYSPTHLLLTSVVWDHADVYPTEQSYFDAFTKLLQNLPESGLFIVSERVEKNLSDNAKCKTITYGKTDDNDYKYTNITVNKKGLEFEIVNNNKNYKITSDLLGEYLVDDMTASFAMASEIGIEADKIIASLKTYKNVKRRLEKRLDREITIIDDIAHSPQKASSVLQTLKKIYNDGRVIAIFEPNTGNRQKEAIAGYDNKFNDVDLVIIPKLTMIKQAPDEEVAIEGEELTEIIQKTQANIVYIDDDEKLVDYIINNTKANDVVAFLGSHGFRNMIESVVEKLK
jgi:UDP-N-acetylmuramate: L-alanyl-gamma-D-glutamyl-meso-diaminopimelate ligase